MNCSSKCCRGIHPAPPSPSWVGIGVAWSIGIPALFAFLTFLESIR